ncbi:hypothetical protein VTH82DRAFT_8288 [Thermothelomyces myriococcoides]
MPPTPGSKKKPAPTHFLCIPLTASPAARAQLAASLTAFRDDVCASLAAGGFDVPFDAVRPVGTMHLTLGVMSFPTPSPSQPQPRAHTDDADSGGGGGGGGGSGSKEKEGEEEEEEGGPKSTGLQRAREVLAGIELRSIWREVLHGRQGDALRRLESMAQGRVGLVKKEEQEQGQEEDDRPRITLRGLASMQSADKAAVLYAPPVDQFGLLQAFCEKVRDVFKEAELMVDDGRPLLLHATVVNTIYVKGNQNGGGGGGDRGKGGRGRKGGKKWERLVFDARGIIDRYEDQVWLENMPVDKVAICRMGATKTMVNGAEDEAYEVEAEVNF